MIDDTLKTKWDQTPENNLDLILFNTQIIAQQHVKEINYNHHKNLKYLNYEIQTTEAQLESIIFQPSLTKAKYNYQNKLQNKLEKLKIDLQAKKQPNL